VLVWKCKRRNDMMNVGKSNYIVKTLAGDYVAIRNSIQFARQDAEKCLLSTGKKCVIYKVMVTDVDVVV